MTSGVSLRIASFFGACSRRNGTSARARRNASSNVTFEKSLFAAGVSTCAPPGSFARETYHKSAARLALQHLRSDFERAQARRMIIDLPGHHDLVDAGAFDEAAQA